MLTFDEAREVLRRYLRAHPRLPVGYIAPEGLEDATHYLPFWREQEAPVDGQFAYLLRNRRVFFVDKRTGEVTEELRNAAHKRIMAMTPVRSEGESSGHDVAADVADVTRLHATPEQVARARRAERRITLISVIPGAFGLFSLWMGVIAPLLDGEPVAIPAVVMAAILIGCVIGAFFMARTARAASRRSVGADGLVFAVSPDALTLADRVIPWREVESVTFRNTAEVGTAGIGQRLAAASGRSFHNIIVTLTDGSTATFPFGSLLGTREFEQAQIATWSVAPVRVRRTGRYADPGDVAPMRDC
ncbi:hypothetical protein ACFS2C_23010 [Prauserella oleivorans]|uniref:Uncharacterized protein n=1 Tax=Prauserella oleivorans TaxID=1478153 RepID=A0ABW5WE47_9PSEU